jgi:uroporphyrinogen decarboxylase
MNAKERMITAFERKKPDRLPVTTHHIIPYFLKTYLGGIDNKQFFHDFHLDPIVWISDGSYREKDVENWRITWESVLDQQYTTWRYTISTPKGNLTAILQSNQYTTWCTEHLLKNKNDISILANYMPSAYSDVQNINTICAQNPESIIRGSGHCGDIFGQPGCWQHAACLYGIENLIMESYDDPIWVKELLQLLQERKLTYINSLKGAKYDIIELGGGDASTTVISPAIFNEFVAPYDEKLITSAHQNQQKIVYHTCGGMMPILEDIAAMGVDAMETFTPIDMGGDTNLAEAKRRIGGKVCIIGGFDQFHFFTGCTEQDTRREVRRCFDEAGGGGWIYSLSFRPFFRC